jgi:putative transcriptional regulator
MPKQINTLQRSRILETVHASAKGLHQIGLIDKRKMEKFDLLCLKEIPSYSPGKIKSLRKKYQLSQAVLAAVINTSLSTVQKLEMGDKHPSGPSLKLLNILEKKGLDVFVG